MRTSHWATAIAWVLTSAGAGLAQESPAGLPFPSQNRTSFAWAVSDGGASRWDIQYNGTVNDGTNDAYDGGMSLTVAGATFSWGSDGLLSADRREVQVGPWTTGDIRVWRRVFVSPKGPYCRWIDIFENTSGSAQTPRVRYQTYVGGGIQVLQTDTGAEQPGPKDTGFLTADGQQGSSRPTLAHVLADRGAKVRPKVQANRGTNQIFYDFDVPIPPGKAVALCLYESQQRSQEAALDFLKKFRPSAELASVPAELRKVILNVGGAFFSAGALEMPRDQRLDLAVLREGGNELLGTIQDSRFVVETPFGKLDLPAEKVLGLAAPPETDSLIQIALADGQVVAGKLLSDPVKFRLELGSEMSLPVAKLSTLAYRVSAGRPADAALSRPTVLTRSGQRLYFKPSDVNYAFLTEAGQIDLKPEHLSAIHMETPEGGLHRAVFRNSSVLAGLLLQKDLKALLDLGPTLSAPATSVSQFLFPGEPAAAAGLCEAALRNEDVLYGRIAQETLEIKTRFGSVKVPRADLAELRLAEGAMDRVEVRLNNGTTVSGQYVGQKVRFQIEPGPEVPLFIGHVVKITCPKPPAVPGTSPATAPGTAPSPAAASDPRPQGVDPDATVLKIRKELQAMQAEKTNLQAQAAELEAQVTKLGEQGRKEEAARTAKMRAEVDKKAADLEAGARKLTAQLSAATQAVR